MEPRPQNAPHDAPGPDRQGRPFPGAPTLNKKGGKAQNLVARNTLQITETTTSLRSPQMAAFCMRARTIMPTCSGPFDAAAAISA
jgi:hypothetical protein